MLTSAQQRDRRIISRFGGGVTSTLRRSVTVQLAVAVAALAGATSLTAKPTDRQTGGGVVAGATFTIAGVTGTYTVASDARVAGGQLALAFTPALAGAAAPNAAITWVKSYADHAYLRMNGRQTLDDERQVLKGRKVRHLFAEPGKPEPRDVDLLDGDPIKDVQVIGSAATTRYRVEVEVRA